MQIIHRLFDSYFLWRKIQKNEKELSKLSPRMLEDIGITKGDIYEVSRNYNG